MLMSRFELAELLGERGDNDAAIKMLRSAIDKEPPPELTERIRLRLGVCLMAKGDTKAALGQFKAVLQNPKSALFAQATYRVGECSMQTGDFAEAAKRFALFRDQGPYQNLPGLTERTLFRLGQALEKQKQWEPARCSLRTGCESLPAKSVGAECSLRPGVGASEPEPIRSSDWAIRAGRSHRHGVGGATAAQHRRVQAGAEEICRGEQCALLVVPDTFDYPHVNALALVEAARAFAENKQKERAIKLLESVIRDYPETESAEAAKKRLTELKRG